jgi:hypothetical protein
MSNKIYGTDRLHEAMRKTNLIIDDVDLISSWNTIIGNYGSIDLGSNNKNQTLNIVGSGNVSTSISGSTLSISLASSLSLTGLSSTGTVNFSSASVSLGTTTFGSAITLPGLTIGSGATNYTLPTTRGSSNQFLMWNGSAVVWAAATAPSTFIGLSDTFGSYSGLGNAILYVNSAGNTISAEASFTYDASTNTLKSENAWISGNLILGSYRAPNSIFSLSNNLSTSIIGSYNGNMYNSLSVSYLGTVEYTINASSSFLSVGGSSQELSKVNNFYVFNVHNGSDLSSVVTESTGIYIFSKSIQTVDKMMGIEILLQRPAFPTDGVVSKFYGMTIKCESATSFDEAYGVYIDSLPGYAAGRTIRSFKNVNSHAHIENAGAYIFNSLSSHAVENLSEDDDEIRMYMKDDNLVITWNDGTTRYVYLDTDATVSGSSPVWTYTTTAP